MNKQTGTGKINRQIKAVFVLFALVIISRPAVAQREVVTIEKEDPLAKPAIWYRLKADPYNDSYWEEYFGQDLFTLDKEHYLNYNKWKAYLVQYKNLENEKKELELMRKREEYFEDRYMNRMPMDIDELTQNIHKNFAVIEQYFEEQFELYGEIYEPFSEKHQKDGYTKVSWVEDHEFKLMQLKGEL